ncbi:hypothetical protein JCM8097_002646 [Rhodosporidiobolus ruineniae]
MSLSSSSSSSSRSSPEPIPPCDIALDRCRAWLREADAPLDIWAYSRFVQSILPNPQNQNKRFWRCATLLLTAQRAAGADKDAMMCALSGRFVYPDAAFLLQKDGDTQFKRFVDEQNVLPHAAVREMPANRLALEPRLHRLFNGRKYYHTKKLDFFPTLETVLVRLIAEYLAHLPLTRPIEDQAPPAKRAQTEYRRPSFEHLYRRIEAHAPVVVFPVAHPILYRPYCPPFLSRIEADRSSTTYHLPRAKWDCEAYPPSFPDVVLPVSGNCLIAAMAERGHLMAPTPQQTQDRCEPIDKAVTLLLEFWYSGPHSSTTLPDLLAQAREFVLTTPGCELYRPVVLKPEEYTVETLPLPPIPERCIDTRGTYFLSPPVAQAELE